MMKKEALDKIMCEIGVPFWGAIVFDAQNIERIKSRESLLKSQMETVECAPPLEKRWLCLDQPTGHMPSFVLAIAVPYRALESSLERPFGIVDAFAWGIDYHVHVKETLKRVHQALKIKGEVPDFCVDTSDHIDREIGLYSGLGFYGDNHMLIHPILGTRFFIGYILYRKSFPIEPFPCNTTKIRFDGCEGCRLCEGACPSKICGPERGSPARCIGMLTQTKGPLSPVDGQLIGGQLYGCSICQKVCPSNARDIEAYHPIGEGAHSVDLRALLTMNNKSFKASFGHMAFAWRSLWVYKRNALIILGNKGDADDYEWLKGYTPPEALEGFYQRALLNLRNRWHP